jgi:DNA-directed RNA polymerase specialized sigma24 family protein
MIALIDFAKDIFQFERIFRPYAFNLTKSREESEDLIQE